MTVSNGMLANQTSFNNGFVSKTATSGNTVTGIVEMANISDPNSGLTFTNAQRYINEIADSDGTVGQADATRKTYSSNNVVANGDSRKTALGKVDAKFDGVTGHFHTGAVGDGPQISALAGLSSFNKFFASFAAVDITAANGATFDASAYFGSSTPGGTSTQVGVVTSAPNNRCQVISTLTGTNVEDANGQRVYARLTEAVGVWTLSFYTNEAGVETAHTLSSQNITVLYREVFNAATRPTFSAEVGIYESLDLTADIVDATATQRGVVSTSAQTFAGKKTLGDGLVLQDSWETPKTDVASAASITAQTYYPFIKLTGATATTLKGIAGGLDGLRVTIHNASSADLTISHEDAGDSAANRFKLPQATNIVVRSDSSAEFIYDSSQSRWVIKSGAGSGGFTTTVSTATLTDNTGTPTAIVSKSATDFKALVATYVLTRGAGVARSGQFLIVSDGTTANYADSGPAAIGTDGVTLTADVSGGNIRWLYTTTNTGTNALLRYEIKELPTP